MNKYILILLLTGCTTPAPPIMQGQPLTVETQLISGARATARVCKEQQGLGWEYTSHPQAGCVLWQSEHCKIFVADSIGENYFLKLGYLYHACLERSSLR